MYKNRKTVKSFQNELKFESLMEITGRGHLVVLGKGAKFPHSSASCNTKEVTEEIRNCPVSIPLLAGKGATEKPTEHTVFKF